MNNRKVYQPPEALELRFSMNHLLETLSAEFAGFSDLEEQEKEFGG